MPSKTFCLCLPENFQNALARHLRKSDFVKFFREAIAEKLFRDYGEKIDVPNMSRGVRNDMRTAAGKAAANENLKRARERRAMFAEIRKMIRFFFETDVPSIAQTGEKHAHFFFKFASGKGMSFDYEIPSIFFETREECERRGCDYDLSMDAAGTLQNRLLEAIKRELEKYERDGETLVGFGRGVGKRVS